MYTHYTSRTVHLLTSNQSITTLEHDYRRQRVTRKRYAIPVTDSVMTCCAVAVHPQRTTIVALLYVDLHTLYTWQCRHRMSCVLALLVMASAKVFKLYIL